MFRKLPYSRTKHKQSLLESLRGKREKRIYNTRTSIPALQRNQRTNIQTNRVQEPSLLRRCLSRFGIWVLFLVGVSVLLLFLLFYVQSLSYFSLKNIDIQGVQRLSSVEVLNIANITPGQNLFTLHIGNIYEKLKASPWIHKLSVRRILPNTLSIDIQENKAAFWIQKDGMLYYADALVFPIAPVEQKFFVSLPVLSIEKGGEDFIITLPRIVEMIHQDIYPLDTRSVSAIKLLSVGRVSFYIDSLSLKITVALTNFQENIAKLRAILEDLSSKGTLDSVRSITVDGMGLIEKQ